MKNLIFYLALFSFIIISISTILDTIQDIKQLREKTQRRIKAFRMLPARVYMKTGVKVSTFTGRYLL